jgi:hypothetical protein
VQYDEASARIKELESSLKTALDNCERLEREAEIQEMEADDAKKERDAAQAKVKELREILNRACKSFADEGAKVVELRKSLIVAEQERDVLREQVKRIYKAMRESQADAFLGVLDGDARDSFGDSKALKRLKKIRDELDACLNSPCPALTAVPASSASEAPKIWHWMNSPGIAACGADYSNISKTVVLSNVTCEACLNVNRGMVKGLEIAADRTTSASDLDYFRQRAKELSGGHEECRTETPPAKEVASSTPPATATNATVEKLNKCIGILAETRNAGSAGAGDIDTLHEIILDVLLSLPTETNATASQKCKGCEETRENLESVAVRLALTIQDLKGLKVFAEAHHAQQEGPTGTPAMLDAGDKARQALSLSSKVEGEKWTGWRVWQADLCQAVDHLESHMHVVRFRYENRWYAAKQTDDQWYIFNEWIELHGPERLAVLETLPREIMEKAMKGESL